MGKGKKQERHGWWLIWFHSSAKTLQPVTQSVQRVVHGSQITYLFAWYAYKDTFLGNIKLLYLYTEKTNWPFIIVI
jgi:hypothetical protein